jgi:phage shock protein PspC (stress-responsive transcriptional regulator)
MFCTNCGTTLRDLDRFCSQCGRRATAEAPPAGEYAPRRMYRLAYDKQIGGVCSGIAKYLDVDVTMVRIIAILIALVTGGLGVLAYIAAWIIMPVDHGMRKPAEPAAAQPGPQPVVS